MQENFDPFEVQGKDIRIQLGGMQWSPDSRKLCFFVMKSSAVSSTTEWFIYDAESKEHYPLQGMLTRDVMPVWAGDGQSLYFQYVASSEERFPFERYELSWFQMPLDGSTFALEYS